MQDNLKNKSFYAKMNLYLNYWILKYANSLIEEHIGKKKKIEDL